MHIVKRKGHTEEFDERKVYASVYSACLAAHNDHNDAENLANIVSREIKYWILKKEIVISSEIFKKVIEELETLNKETAFMYKTHRDIS